MSSDAVLVPMASGTHHTGRAGQVVRSVYDGFTTLGGVLRSHALATGSGRQYQGAVMRWLTFCREAPSHRHRPIHRRSGIRQLDRCVCMYMASVYHYGSGRRRQLAVNTVYGLYYVFPAVRGQLVESEQLIRGWTRLRPSVSRPPLTWPLVTLIAVTMAMNNYGEGALATLVAFDGLLRISEVTSLRVRDISSPSDLRRGRSRTSVGDRGMPSPISGHVLLRLAVTKTGSNQWVELTNSTVEHLLLQHVSGRDGDQLAFQLLLPGHMTSAASAYRHVLRVVLSGLNLQDVHFTPHSLRHGGATHALLHLNQSIERVMHRGRWQSVNSCRIYLQAGRAQLLHQVIDSDVLVFADQVAGDWSNTIRVGLQLPSQ